MSAVEKWWATLQHRLRGGHLRDSPPDCPRRHGPLRRGVARAISRLLELGFPFRNRSGRSPCRPPLMHLDPFLRRRQIKLVVAVLAVGVVMSALVALALIYMAST